MGKISEEWHDARLDILDKFWKNQIDFETFKREITEVDERFRNPDKADEYERENTKKKIKMYKQKIEDVKKEKWWRRLDNDA